MQHTLELYHDDTLLFFSDRQWLHPLFELEQFLQTSALPLSSLILHDKIVGRSAALMIAKLGITHVYTPVLSRRALDVIKHYQLNLRYDRIIDKIGCSSEDFLSDCLNADEAYQILHQRAFASGAS